MWKIIKWGYIPVSALFLALGIFSQAKEASTWGAPAWVWILVGSVTLISSSLVIIIKLSNENNKLKKPVDLQKWNKIREEKIRLRKPYENRLGISEILLKMEQLVWQYTAKQLEEQIPKKIWKDISDDVKVMVTKPKVLTLLLLPKLPGLAKKLNATKLIVPFLLDVTAVLKRHGYGSLEVENDTEYKALHDKVKNLEVGLPAKICEAIESDVVISQMMSSMQIFEPSQSAFKNMDFDPQFINKFQYLLPTTHMMLSKSHGNIHSMIEKWLTGDDL
jgi:hypothetical protein